MFEDNLRNLCDALIISACKDYISALRRKDRRKIDELEVFFRGDSFIDFSFGRLSGEAVIKEIRQQSNQRVQINQKRRSNNAKNENKNN